MRIILQVLDVHYRSILGGNMLLLIPGTLSHLLACSELPDFMKLGHLPILTPEKFAAYSREATFASLSFNSYDDWSSTDIFSVKIIGVGQHGIFYTCQ